MVKNSELQKTKVAEIETLAKTYQRGHKQVFTPHIMKGALPSSPIKKVQKGKGNMVEEDIHEATIHDEDDLHETEIDFDLVDLDDEHDDEVSKMIIK